MIPTISNATVTFNDMKATIMIEPSLSRFIDSIKRAFKLDDRPFAIYSIINNAKLKIKRKEDYVTICTEAKTRDIELVVETERNVENINLDSVQQSNDEELTPVGSTPTGNEALHAERMGTKLEILQEESKVLINNGLSFAFRGAQAIQAAQASAKITAPTKKCFVCNAESPAKRACKGCQGTGQINAFIYDKMEKLLEKNKKTIEEFQTKIQEKDNEIIVLKTENGKLTKIIENIRRKYMKLKNEYIELKQKHSGIKLDPNAESKSKLNSFLCAKCSSPLSSGQVAYMCKECKVYLCEKCGRKIKHSHELHKTYIDEDRSSYKAELIPSEVPECYGKAGGIVELALTAWNKGNDFDPNTLLKSLDLDGFCPIAVGAIKAGNKVELVLKINLPKEPKNKYNFRLFAEGKYFGSISTIKMAGVPGKIKSSIKVSEAKVMDAASLSKISLILNRPKMSGING